MIEALIGFTLLIIGFAILIYREIKNLEDSSLVNWFVVFLMFVAIGILTHILLTLGT